MEIRYVTCSHPWTNGDEFGSANVVTHDEFDPDVVSRHQECLARYEELLFAHDASIKGVTKTVEQNAEEVRKHGDRIAWAEHEINKMPQTLSDTLGTVLNETLGSQIDAFANQLAKLREERDAVTRQLDELRRQRDDINSQLEESGRQRDEMKTQLEELRRQCDKASDLIESIPVARKFASFLFVSPKPKKSISKKEK